MSWSVVIGNAERRENEGLGMTMFTASDALGSV